MSTIRFAPDAVQGQMAHLRVTLSATVETLTTVTLPDWATGLRLFPSADVRYAVGEAPATPVAASSATSIAASAFGLGGIAKTGVWETRLLQSGVDRTLQLRAAAASVTVDIVLH